MNKFDRFIAADNSVGPAKLTLEIGAKFAKYGTFSIDNADIILVVSKLEKIVPELIAVTWMNETTFRFYSEPNKNGQPNNFDAWDVGPMQMNVGWTKKDLQVGFFSDKGINISRVLGTAADLYDGDPLDNLRLASRSLLARGRGTVAGPNNTTIFEPVNIKMWERIPDDMKNLRRAVAYTGPDAREKRMESYQKFAPMFKKFFEVYGQA